MKKGIAVLLVLALLALSGAALAEEEKVLNVFTWEGYFDDTTLAQFSDETGIQINYSTFASNEEMLLKLQANGGSEYDIVLASDYAISAARKQNLLLPLDKEKLTNWDNLNPDYLNQYFDPDNVYSMPYTVGSPMIVYDPDQVEGELKSFSDLWREDLKDSVWLINDARVSIGATLKTLGYSYNTTDQAQLDEAAAKLAELKPNVRVLDYDMNYNYLANGEVKAAYLFTPFVVLSMMENPNLVAAAGVEPDADKTGGCVPGGGHRLRHRFDRDSRKCAASGKRAPVHEFLSPPGDREVRGRVAGVHQSERRRGSAD